MIAAPKPKSILLKKSSQNHKNAIYKILREDILGYVKFYGKETVIPWLEEILEEAKAKKTEEYFK